MAEQTKESLRQKLMEERKYWRQRTKGLEKQIELLRAQYDEAVEQIKKAHHNLTSAIIKNYGTERENGDYELRIPVPEGGWLTAAKKEDDQYVLVAKKIE